MKTNFAKRARRKEGKRLSAIRRAQKAAGKPAPKKPDPPYLARWKILQSMGFKDYPTYLLSDLWATIRTKVLVREAYLCQTCGEPANTVHHLGYGRNTLLGNKLTALVAVCGRCHWKIEFWAPGVKRTPIEAQSKTRKMLRLRRIATGRTRKALNALKRSQGQQYQKPK